VEGVALLSPLALCAFLGWWAGRHGDRLPLLAAMAGPVLLVAVYGVVPWLPTGRSDGDHYSLAADLAMWLLVTVLGVGAAALGAFAGGRRAARQHAGEPAAPAVMLLMVVASLLVAAALFSVWSHRVWSYRGDWLDAGAAGLALGAGLALRRRAALSALAGAFAAAAGVAGLAVLAGVLGDRSQLFGAVPSIVGPLVLAGLLGAFARGARGAAWFAVAAGALHVVAPLHRKRDQRTVGVRRQWVRGDECCAWAAGDRGCGSRADDHPQRSRRLVGRGQDVAHRSIAGGALAARTALVAD
jgi:hypothetical protein